MSRSLVFVAPAEGGPGSAAYSVLPHLRERGWSVTDVWLSRLSSSSAASIAAKAMWRNRRALRDIGVVHVEIGKLDLPCFWFALFATLAGVRVTVTAHDAPMLALHPVAGLLPQRRRIAKILVYRIFAPLFDAPLEAALLRRVRAVGVLSGVGRDGWTGRASPRRVIVMAHGADPRGEQGPPSTGKAVLLAGYLGPGKGLDTLLTAWRTVGGLSHLPLWIAGDTTDSTYADWVEGLRAKSATMANPPVWLGAVTDEEWGRLFQSAAVVVLPYRSSSPASGPLVRAMIEGRAVIMSRVPAAREMINDGTSGLLVPIDDPVALSDALRRVIRDPDLMDRLGRAAEEAIGPRCNWKNQARGIEATLVAGLT